MPRILKRAMGLVWDAAPREAWLVVVMVTLQGLGVFVLLVQVANVLTEVIKTEGGQDAANLPIHVVVFIVASSLIGVAGVVINNRRAMLGARVNLHVEQKLLEVACLAELDDYDDPGFHDRLQRARGSAGGRPMGMVEGLIELVRAVFTLIGLAAALIFIEPWIALFVALSVVPIWLGGVRSAGHYFDFVLEMTQGDRMRTYIFDLLSTRPAAPEVRAAQLGDALRGRWHTLVEERIDSMSRMLRKRFRVGTAASVASNTILGLVAVILIVLTQVDVLSLAEAATAAGALLIFTQKLVEAVEATNSLFEDAPLLWDLDGFLELKSLLVEDRSSRSKLREDFHDLEVDNISFTYKRSNHPAIHGVSLRIRAGEVIALVGENGSGKTTLTKLLCGLYPIDEGRILVDGVDLSTIEPESWRSRVAVVFQDYLRFDLTARDNVHFGAISREASDEEIRRAARAAGADEFLTALPWGYDTSLSPRFNRGQDLSLGQWQRVALARAFFKEAPLVILDEPTAALDARAEKALFDTVRDLYVGRTVILISHRFSTVRTADRIVVLAEGEVVEEGSHEQLMANEGLYAELFTMQASSYLDPAPVGAGSVADAPPETPSPVRMAGPDGGRGGGDRGERRGRPVGGTEVIVGDDWP